MADYRLVSGGVRRASDGAHIPENTGNRDWNAYLAWLAVPNTPDPVLARTLEEAQVSAKLAIAATAAALGVTAGAPATPVALYVRLQLEAQAVLCDADGSPDPGSYPLLDARVAVTEESLAAAADAVIAAKATLVTALTAIEAVRLAAEGEIDDAADADEVDDVVAAIEWP